MKSLLLQRHATARVLVVLALALVATFAANAVVRPGCSLLPIAVPDDARGSSPASPEQACAVLGRPLPRAAVLPDGLRESGMSISGGGPVGIPRIVRVAYAKDSRNVVLLQLMKGNEIPPGNVNEVNGIVAGVPAIVQQVHLSSIDADDVHYLWVRDGLLFSLHVQLAPGISRQAADAMAASIR